MLIQSKSFLGSCRFYGFAFFFFFFYQSQAVSKRRENPSCTDLLCHFLCPKDERERKEEEEEEIQRTRLLAEGAAKEMQPFY